MMGLKAFLKIAASALLVESSLGATPLPLTGSPPAIDPSQFTTGRLIVQFSEEGSARLRKRDGSIDTSEFIAEVSEVTGQSAAPALTFDSDLFQGVSLDLKDLDSASINDIKDIPGVQNVWPAGRFTIPPASEATVKSDGIPLWSPHRNTRVNELHEKGTRGAGVVVAIVDSGIDYSHPSLGGGFGPGFKVESGYDFVGDDYDGSGNPTPDDDPMDCQGHGTHVAGIISSDREDLLGVAPDAQLRGYRVFGCDGSTSEDIVIAAVLRAYDEGADVLNLSLGSAVGFPYMAISLVLTAIQAGGTFVAAAAGNSAGLGPFFIGNTGQGFETMTVAAAEEAERAAFIATAHSSTGESRDIPYLDWVPSKAWNRTGTFNAYFDPDTTTRNNCGRLGSHGKIPNKEDILLLKRGDCAWLTHDDTLWDNVRWVFIYNHEGAAWEVPTRYLLEPERQTIGFAVITYEDGMWLLDQYNNNATVQYEFTDPPKARAINMGGADGVRAASFSTYGPTLDVRMKPEISAPGANILSTYLVKEGSWAVFSGTSMATPYIAGVAALYLSVHGTRAEVGAGAAAAARRRMIASAKPIATDKTANAHYGVGKVGAGLVDAVKAVDYTTFISPSLLELNETAFFKKDHTVKVTNMDSSTVTYRIFHQVLNTVLVREQGNREIYTDPLLFGGDGYVATLELSATEITVEPGETAQFSVSFAEPSQAMGYQLPIYAGNIVLVGSNNEEVRVTYMGIKGSLKDQEIFSLTGVNPLLLKNEWDGDLRTIEDGDEFQLGKRLPGTAHYLRWATEELSYDFVASDWTPEDWVYPPVQGQNKWFGSMHSGAITYPYMYHPRIEGLYLAWGFYDTFAQGGGIPPGEYRVLGRGLRTSGDRNNIKDWQYALTPFFTITPRDNTTTTQGPTSTPTQVTTTTTTTPPPFTPTPGATLLELKAKIPALDTVYPLCQGSDFLQFRVKGETCALYEKFILTDTGNLLSRMTSSGKDVFAAVYTALNDSLIYMYPTNSIKPPWEQMQCNLVDSELQCTSVNKTVLYGCTPDWQSLMPLRMATTIPDGCHPVILEALVLSTPEPVEPTTTLMTSVRK